MTRTDRIIYSIQVYNIVYVEKRLRELRVPNIEKKNYMFSVMRLKRKPKLNVHSFRLKSIKR